jgi:hypothetical protein
MSDSEGQVPSDPSGSEDEIPLDLRRVVLPVVATGTDFSLKPVGTAFIIHAHGKHALAFSAAHCLQYIARLDSPRERHHETTPHEFRIQIQDIDLSNVKGRVLYPDHGGKMHVLNLANAYVMKPFDIAVCRLDVPDALSSRICFDKRIVINSGPPKIGTKIVAIGYSNIEILEHEVIGPQAHAKINLKLNRRFGQISNVFPITGPRNEPYPCFQCTTPFDDGMSGGPIIDVSEEQPVAIGIISYDMSFDVSWAGSGECAVATMLWPAMGTKMKWEFLNDKPEPCLVDFEELGLIEDRGKAHKHVRITPGASSNELRIHWNDNGADQHST